MPAIKPVSRQALVKIFELDGFTFDRQKGDHLIYTKPDIKRPIVIPMYSAVVPSRFRNRVTSSDRN
jgi:predicted RNA binding protein YcfA (HicA-like mRNA interferase family)